MQRNINRCRYGILDTTSKAKLKLTSFIITIYIFLFTCMHMKIKAYEILNINYIRKDTEINLKRNKNAKYSIGD